jgi:hypothetical protein
MFFYSTGMTPEGLDTTIILSGGSATYKEDLKRKTNYYHVHMLCIKNPRMKQEIAIRCFIFSPRSLPSNVNTHSTTGDATTWGRATDEHCDEARRPP